MIWIKVWINKDKPKKIVYSDFMNLIKNNNTQNKINNMFAQEYPLKDNKKIHIINNGQIINKDTKERKHIVSFSGGKDSTALLIRMLELNMKIDEIIFADTLYELPEMYEYIDKVEKYIQERFDKNLIIKKTSPDTTLESWVKGEVTRGKYRGKERGFPLTIYPCYWSRTSKFVPMNILMQGHHRYLGIATDESHRESINKDDSLYHYPLIDWGWTEQDCMDYLVDIDLVNPLYKNRSRTGCFWCPKQNISSKRLLFKEYPKLWNQMKEWESTWGHQIFLNTTMDELESRFIKELKK